MQSLLPARLYVLPGAQGQAAALAELLGLAQAPMECRRFPDGETYLRLPEAPPSHETAIVVAALREPDAQLPRLLFLAELLRELGTPRVGLVAPYLPYMRQDARLRPGEALTSASVARWIDERFDWLVTVEPHLHRIATLAERYRRPAQAVSSAPAVARWIRAEVRSPHIVGPDVESTAWVREVARLAGCGASVMQKRREGDRLVHVALLPEDAPRLSGCTPVLVDDIVSSGGTLAQALRVLGVVPGLLAQPVCVAVHAIFAPGAAALLAEAGAGRVVSCNTIAHESNAIDVLPDLAEAIRHFSTRTEEVAP